MCTRWVHRNRSLPRGSSSFAVVLLVPVLLWATSVASVQETQEQRRSLEREKADIREFMNAKLAQVEEALRGIVTRDFEKTADSSRAISLLCIEERWNRVMSVESLERSREFRRTANQLTRAAEDENPDAAALHFLRLTSQCFDCHDAIHRNRRLVDERREGDDRPEELER